MTGRHPDTFDGRAARPAAGWRHLAVSTSGLRGRHSAPRTISWPLCRQVADELVAELCPPAGAAIGASPDQQYEQKNIRRRVYDALNVLMAMQIISKERKQIKWLGLAPMTVPAEVRSRRAK